jgi:hypothetical protein
MYVPTIDTYMTGKDRYKAKQGQSWEWQLLVVCLREDLRKRHFAGIPYAAGTVIRYRRKQAARCVPRKSIHAALMPIKFTGKIMESVHNRKKTDIRGDSSSQSN